MSVSSVSSGQGPDSSQFQQRKADFSSLSSALSSGDLGSAQQAFTTLTQDLQSSAKGSKLTSDPNYQALQTALQNGDTAGAQKAFAALQQDIKAHKGGHHHKAADGDADDANSASSASSSSTASVSSTSSTDAASLIAQVQAAETAAANGTGAQAAAGSFVNLTA